MRREQPVVAEPSLEPLSSPDATASLEEEGPELSDNRDFQLLWVGSAVSALGSRISGIAYPLLVLALTASPADAGLAGFAATISHLLFQLPAGVLVDRWNRKRVMMVCDAVRAVAVGSIALASYLGNVSLPHILAAAFIEGTLTVFSNICEPVALRRIVPTRQLLPALSRLEARERIAMLLGQPLGGFAFSLGRWVPFLADFVSYLISLATVLLIKTRLEPDQRASESRLTTAIQSTLSWMWKQPLLRDTTLLVASSNLLFQVLVLLLLVIAKEQGASTTAIGFMIAGSGLGGVIGSLVAPWVERQSSIKAVVLGANWVWALLMPAVAMFQNLYVLGAIFGLMAFVGSIWNVAVGVYRLAVTPESMLGRVESVSGMVAMGALPLGSLLGGYLLEFTGPHATALWLVGAMLLLACLATLSPSLRRATRPGG